MSVRNRNAAAPVQDTRNAGQISGAEPTRQDKPPSRDEDPTPSSTTVASAILSPALLTSFVLIFGGCCSNVYILESILSFSPASGPLVTFLQFFLTALFTLPSQLTTKTDSSVSRPSSSSSSSFSSWPRLIPRLRTRNIPLRKWFMYTIMFLTANMLNNTAFNYRISVPLHIIIRSAGPVSSMLTGYVFAGRRYPLRKVMAVMLLFAGVVMAALADAASKGKIATTSASSSSADSALSQQLQGFVLLVTALFISAWLGIYSDRMYSEHGRDAGLGNENLFYSHVLSLPYFATQFRGLYGQYVVLISSATKISNNSILTTGKSNLPGFLRPFESYVPISYVADTNLPIKPILLLLANAITQILCISGVNELATQTTSLTVSVVLNTRKLVSLLLSIWLFGNKLPFGVVAGASLVFLGAGIYSLPGRPKPAEKNEKKDR